MPFIVCFRTQSLMESSMLMSRIAQFFRLAQPTQPSLEQRSQAVELSRDDADRVSGGSPKGGWTPPLEESDASVVAPAAPSSNGGV